MAKKLTQTQIHLLNWMLGGNSVDFCTEVSNQLGVMKYSTPPEFETDRRSLLNLLRDGYLDKVEQYSFGIRWTVLTINTQGITFLEGFE